MRHVNGRDDHSICLPAPQSETERLRALRSYKILDTKPEERFDELTQLAAIICGVPISLITLIDADRHWFKSKVGLEIEETPRTQAFCTHAIMQPQMFVVRTLRRTSASPATHSSPAIRKFGSTLVRR